MKHKLIKSREELFEWICEIWDENKIFNSPEEFDGFFGLDREWDEETGEYLENIRKYTGKIDCEPEYYPSIFVYSFGEFEDRFGTIKERIFDWVSIDEFNKEDE